MPSVLPDKYPFFGHVFVHQNKMQEYLFLQTKSSQKIVLIALLCNWVFDNFILAGELFAKALQSLGTCVLVSNNMCGKLFSSIESPRYKLNEWSLSVRSTKRPTHSSADSYKAFLLECRLLLKYIYATFVWVILKWLAKIWDLNLAVILGLVRNDLVCFILFG